MGYLLETNILSELRKPGPNPAVVAWFGAVSSDGLYVSVLTLGEVRQGVERLRKQDESQADARIAEQWGRMNAVRPLPVVDGLLAATAISRGWTLVTRNVKDTRGFDLDLLDPFAGQGLPG